MNTTAPSKKRTAERIEFLTDCLIGAVGHCGYGWFTVNKWQPDEADGKAYALVTENEDSAKHHLDLDTVAKGIGVIKAAKPAEFPNGSGADRVLANVETGERLYLSEDARRRILECDRENDASELDVVLALAIVECGLFGRVVYA